mmetsp:Transcript_51737/g.138054  ORF Transcript_51737/g.138054 Transcript_51737/m.138054 type:complete len:94 (+) Transcript_51737:1143-1424(+)
MHSCRVRQLVDGRHANVPSGEEHLAIDVGTQQGGAQFDDPSSTPTSVNEAVSEGSWCETICGDRELPFAASPCPEASPMDWRWQETSSRALVV